MYKTLIVVISLAIIAILVIVFNKKTNFEVTSPDITPNTMLNIKQVYSHNGCKGQNIAPRLLWSNAPKETKSFAIICHDPDAPHANGWYHWLMINIPADVSEITSGVVPAGATTTINDFKNFEYDGPCPPKSHGIHRYNFTVYALDAAQLDIAPQTLPTEVEKRVEAHSIAKSTITGLYERK